MNVLMFALGFLTCLGLGLLILGVAMAKTAKKYDEEMQRIHDERPQVERAQ